MPRPSAFLARFCALFLSLLISLVPHSSSAGSVLLDGSTQTVGTNLDPKLSFTTFTVETWFKRAAGGTTTTIGSNTCYPIVARGTSATFGIVVLSDGKVAGTIQDT